MKKLRRLLFITGIVFLSIFVLAFIFISPITKYLIEKYSVTYTGRQIRMDKLFVNLLTGSLSSEGLRIYEKNGKDVFFSCGKFTGHIAIYKLWAGSYDITRLEFEKPEMTLIQTGKQFNFSDLKKRFWDDYVNDTSSTGGEPVKYWIRNLAISNCRVTYINTLPYNKVEIDQASVKLPLIAWNNSQYDLSTDFRFPAGGAVNMLLNLNEQSGNYQLNLGVDSLNLAWLYPYLKDYMKVSRLEGFFSTVLQLEGNTNTPEAIAASGTLGLNQFSIVDNEKDQLIGVGDLGITVDSVNTRANLYRIKAVSVDRPFLNLAMYDDGYNFERIMTSPMAESGVSDSADNYANVFTMLADYTRDIVQNYVVSNYNADDITLTNGRMIFTDYTLEQKFQFQLDSLHMKSEKISSSDSSIYLELASLLNRTGSLKASLKINPANFSDMQLDAVVGGLLISDFNPYSVYYVATPFMDGRIYYRNRTVIYQRKLENDNELDVLQIVAGKKVRNKTAMKLPVRLAVSLLKDVKGDIHLKVPVRGSLDDPKFRWGKIVWQVLKNLMLKAVTAPYKLLAGKFGGAEKDYKELNFGYEQENLLPEQEHQLDLLTDVALKEESVKLEFVQMVNLQDEAEYLATKIMKKRFLHITADSLSAADQARIEKLPLKDSAFVAYVDGQVGVAPLLSVQEKCIRICGSDSVQAIINRRMEARNSAVMNYLLQKKVPAERIAIRNAGANEVLSRNQPPRFLVNLASTGEPDMEAAPAAAADSTRQAAGGH